MRLLRSALTLASILICSTALTSAQATFQSAEIISAGDVQFPVSSIASGILVLDVSLNSKGEVTGIEVKRDVPSLTSLAESSVEAWKYRPASVDGVPQASVLRVAFAFRPRAILAAPPVFEPLLRDSAAREAKSGFVPAGISGAAYPSYPIDAANVGAVVVQVKVGANGEGGDVKFIRSFNPFNRFSLQATRKWQFQPATFRGDPVTSSIVLVFVNSLPGMTN